MQCPKGCHTSRVAAPGRSVIPRNLESEKLSSDCVPESSSRSSRRTVNAPGDRQPRRHCHRSSDFVLTGRCVGRVECAIGRTCSMVCVQILSVRQKRLGAPLCGVLQRKLVPVCRDQVRRFLFGTHGCPHSQSPNACCTWRSGSFP